MDNNRFNNNILIIAISAIVIFILFMIVNIRISNFKNDVIEDISKVSVEIEKIKKSIVNQKLEVSKYSDIEIISSRLNQIEDQSNLAEIKLKLANQVLKISQDESNISETIIKNIGIILGVILVMAAVTFNSITTKRIEVMNEKLNTKLESFKNVQNNKFQNLSNEYNSLHKSVESNINNLNEMALRFSWNNGISTTTHAVNNFRQKNYDQAIKFGEEGLEDLEKGREYTNAEDIKHNINLAKSNLAYYYTYYYYVEQKKVLPPFLIEKVKNYANSPTESFIFMNNLDGIESFLFVFLHLNSTNKEKLTWKGIYEDFRSDIQSKDYKVIDQEMKNKYIKYYNSIKT